MIELDWINSFLVTALFELLERGYLRVSEAEAALAQKRPAADQSPARKSKRKG